jgi:hypothetical protein
VSSGQLDREVGSLTVQLLQPYLGGSPFQGDADEDQGNGKGNGKGGD